MECKLISCYLFCQSFFEFRTDSKKLTHFELYSVSQAQSAVAFWDEHEAPCLGGVKENHSRTSLTSKCSRSSNDFTVKCVLLK